jgi:beta-mannosidase
VLGRFVDASWAYRFGPPGHDTIVTSLEGIGEDGIPILLAQDYRFPVARPATRESAAQLGLTARVRASGSESALVIVTSARLLYGVRLSVPGFEPLDDAFCVEPGHARTVLLRRRSAPPGQSGEDRSGGAGPAPAGGSLSALNLSGATPIEPVPATD